MYAVVKEASRFSLVELMAEYDIDEDELEEIEDWFDSELKIGFFSPKYMEDK